MSAKAKKNGSWFQCDKCQANIVNKDLESHTSKNCPPSSDVFVHPYILNAKLFGSLEIKTNEEIKGIEYHEKNNLLFMSQSVIQLCHLIIGDWCVLKPKNCSFAPSARIVWPTIEKSSNSILVTQTAYDLYWKNRTDVKVCVSKLNTFNAKQAKQIILVAVNAPKTLQFTSELNVRIKKLHLNRFVTEGNKLCCMFYGKNIEFLIKQIIEAEPDTEPRDNLKINFIANEESSSGGAVRNLENEFTKLTTKLNEEDTIVAAAAAEKDEVKNDDDDDDDDDAISSFYKITNTTVFKLFASDKDLKPIKQINPLSEIGGYEKEIQEIFDLIDVALGRVPTIQSLKITRGLLLYGASGTGKTLIANGVAQMCRCRTIININGPDLFAKYAGAIEETIVNQFHEAIRHSPSIILLDELDVLCPMRTSRITDQEKRVISTLLMQFDRLNALQNDDCNVFVIATTNNIDHIDPAFRRSNRLDREIEIGIPSPVGRYKILMNILSRTIGINNNNNNNSNNSNSLTDDEIKDIANNSHGFVGSDLMSLVSRAGLCAIKRNVSLSTTTIDDSQTTMNITILYSDLRYALSKVQPSAMRAIQIEVPNVKWSDIGGQEKLKLILRQAVEWPLKYTASFERMGITPPRGVLMYGPPGCSKTMIAKALATESHFNFLSIKGPELFSKYVGESERAIREVFRKARQVAPSIVFFDEIDAIGGERTNSTSGGGTSGGTSVQERVLAQLLTELDGITPLKDVTIVAATNRPDRIDRALVRPGRLDRIVYVPLPDPETRKEIFALKLSKMPTDSCVDVARLVELTDNYSGAEIQAVCHEAAMCSLEEDIQATVITWTHFEKALQIITPRTPKTLLNIYEDYANQS